MVCSFSFILFLCFLFSFRSSTRSYPLYPPLTATTCFHAPTHTYQLRHPCILFSRASFRVLPRIRVRFRSPSGSVDSAGPAAFLGGAKWWILFSGSMCTIYLYSLFFPRLLRFPLFLLFFTFFFFPFCRLGRSHQYRPPYPPMTMTMATLLAFFYFFYRVRVFLRYR